MGNVYLSICIPTNGRIEILKNTLDSIYNNCTVDFSEFEIVLSDNSKNDELIDLLHDYKKYPNIVYRKTNCEGFLNSINALKLGQGDFLKLHNNYTAFTDQGLTQLMAFIKGEYVMKPLVFFTNLGKDSLKKYNSFDEFNSELSFWNSWSSGFSIWKKDFDKISNVEVNKMFPHTSLFLLQYSKKSYIKNDVVYFNNQEVSKKGGYDLFKTFAVDYLRMIEQATLEGNLSNETFNKIKKDLYFDFLISWYQNTKILKNDYTFQLDNIKESLAVYYSKNSYYKLVVWAYFTAFKNKFKSLLKK
ncbi:glycosyltransferase family 2 protein [Flavobacterium hercynium]|uniref:Glycosyltransferase 2-like domain-containing protein n=1 Tax=Flavobacterium hercynium TaxID=387094 RepID=A0A226HEV7_9FLAO|nr:glycosyltransferase family 2 protein [Flavobacterium hercynium]OXA92186.1 hypothetical protein B0A66_10495 [Flavobacterium hercynium]SMP24541.1 Glycosyl transferase family 2 [Flavobacterium hercynium]